MSWFVVCSSLPTFKCHINMLCKMHNSLMDNCFCPLSNPNWRCVRDSSSTVMVVKNHTIEISSRSRSSSCSGNVYIISTGNP